MLLMKQRFSVGLLTWYFLVVPLLSPHDAGFFLGPPPLLFPSIAWQQRLIDP